MGVGMVIEPFNSVDWRYKMTCQLCKVRVQVEGKFLAENEGEIEE